MNTICKNDHRQQVPIHTLQGHPTSIAVTPFKKPIVIGIAYQYKLMTFELPYFVFVRQINVLKQRKYTNGWVSKSVTPPHLHGQIIM